MVQVSVAANTDDAELRRLVAIPMPGAISLGFEREPNFFLAGAIEGDVYDAVAVREETTHSIVGVGCRSVRDAWINGGSGRLGYMGQLRIAPAFRGRSVLAAGFAGVRKLHDANPVPFYVTTIVADNVAARAVLEKRRTGKPHYEPWSELVSLAVLLGRKQGVRQVAGVRVRDAGPEDIHAIVDCLARNNSRFQFAPAWTVSDLTSERCRGLRATDFVVATRGGAIVGCLAIWDQQAFKQTVVRGYGGPLRVARTLYNGVAPIAGLPKLPAVGESIRHGYASHVAVDDDDVGVGIALLAHASNRALVSGHTYLTLGLCRGHPLLVPLGRRFRHIAYRSIVYVVYYPDGEEAVRRLDRRTPHLELAVL